MAAKQKKHYYGCIPSTMDGTEHIVEIEEF